MNAIKRVDRNHREICDAIRQVGGVVIDTHTVPGALDAVVAFRSVLYILEIKDGTKPASARKLTPAEQETIRLLASVGVKAHIVTSVEDALRAIGAIL